MVILFFLYISVSYYLCSKVQGEVQIRKIVMQLIGFPIVYFIAFFPLTMVRLLNIFMDLPLEAAYVAVFFEPCDGILNVLWYGYTRKIFSKICARRGEYVKIQVTDSLSLNE